MEDPSQKAAVRSALEERYGGDVHVHENAWTGLYGIIGAMRALLAGMYVVVAVFILIVVTLTGGKILSVERRDLSVYRTLGFSADRLQRSFALRFGAVALTGSFAGLLCSALLTDPLVSALMRMCGISNFTSHPGLGSVLLPAAAVTALFLSFAYFSSGSIGRANLTALVAE